jgi:hypothetical protein
MHLRPGPERWILFNRVHQRPECHTLDSTTSHGGVVIGGSGNVIIGNSHSPAPFIPPLPIIGQPLVAIHWLIWRIKINAWSLCYERQPNSMRC